MTCTSDRPIFRALGPRALKGARTLLPLACAALLGCSDSLDGPALAPAGSGSMSGGPMGSTPDPQGTLPVAQGTDMPGSTPSSTASASPTGAVPGGPGVPGAGGAGGGPGTEVPLEPEVPPVPLSEGETRLRLLTQAEYSASVQALLGPVTVDLTTAPDTSVAGFVAVGAGLMNVTDAGATAYEAASRAAVAEVFRDAERWPELVGCEPADLSDACVATYIETFGRKAFRRDLVDEEVQQWLAVAQSVADLEDSSIQQALSAATVGMLQSPNFLYRVEVNSLDVATSRLKYDGPSMATRLAYTLTGAPPSPELLDAAAAGQLDTAEGVRASAASLLADSRVADRMAEFFGEYAQLSQVTHVAKSSTHFPEFTAELQGSMLEGAQLFLRNVVLGPNADVRSFYTGLQTYVDENLAEIYGVDAPASGFEQITLPADSKRVGLLGQAAFLAGQSQTDRTSPTRRGVFLLQTLYCQTPPPPPDGVDTTLAPPVGAMTEREILEAHRVNPQCATCHALFDPFGIALENFDPIGRYRETDEGLPIDASGEFGGRTFDGPAELGAMLAEDPAVQACLLRNFYRSANGRAEDDEDSTQIAAMAELLAANGYVWNDFLSDFVASDAFRSAPALPLTETP